MSNFVSIANLSHSQSLITNTKFEITNPQSEILLQHIGHGSKRIAGAYFQGFTRDAVAFFRAEENNRGGDVTGIDHSL